MGHAELLAGNAGHAQHCTGGVCAAQGLKWEYAVIRSDTMNAFVLPGGKVRCQLCRPWHGLPVPVWQQLAAACTMHTLSGAAQIVVFTGLLDLLDVRDEVAAVLGHEAGHVVARHHVRPRACHARPLRCCTAPASVLLFFSMACLPSPRPARALTCSSAGGQAERISRLALLSLLQILIFLFLGVDIPPILTNVLFELPNSRSAPLLLPCPDASLHVTPGHLCKSVDADPHMHHWRFVSIAATAAHVVGAHAALTAHARAGPRRKRPTSSAWTWRRARASSLMLR